MILRDDDKQYALLSKKSLGSVSRKRRSTGLEDNPNVIFTVAAVSMVVIYFVISFLTGL